MTNNNASDIMYMVLIAGRRQEDELLDALSTKACHIITIVHATGSVQASVLLEVFGLVPEENKTLITCLASKEESDQIMDMLVADFGFDKPNTGIAYTIPVESMSY